MAKHQFFKPFIYVFSGATSFLKSIDLIVVSLSVIASLIAILILFDWVMKYFLGFDVVRIASTDELFVKFICDSAPVIYSAILALLTAFLLSKIADKLLRGSGGTASKIQ